MDIYSAKSQNTTHEMASLTVPTQSALPEPLEDQQLPLLEDRAVATSQFEPPVTRFSPRQASGSEVSPKRSQVPDKEVSPKRSQVPDKNDAWQGPHISRLARLEPSLKEESLSTESVEVENLESLPLEKIPLETGPLEIEPLEIEPLETGPLGQIVPVDSLSNVTPHDWASTALQHLASQYGCAPQFSPSATMNASSDISRHDFAVYLERCLTSVGQDGFSASESNLEAVQRLGREFSSELSRVRSQIENTSSDIERLRLQSQQFSPTTTLRGEVIFAATGALGNTRADDNAPIDSRLAFGHRVRLNIESSFTGADRLQIRLQARDMPELEEVTGTQMTNLSFDGADGNQVEISRVDYRFPLGQNAGMIIRPLGASLGAFVPTINPYFDSSSVGAVSNFGTSNPVLSQGSGAGIALSYDFYPSVNLAVGYAAQNASDASRGFFGDEYGAIAQLTAQPFEVLTVGATYIYSLNQFDTGAGSAISNNPFNDESESIRSNTLALEAALDLGPGVTLGGRLGFMQGVAQDLPNRPIAHAWTWSAMVAFPGLGGESNLGGFLIGQPPKLTHNSFDNALVDPDTALHLEAFYRWQLNDRLSITPGFFMVTNPDHNRNNPPIFVGVIRTTFRF